MPRYSPVQSLLDLITAELDPSNVLSKSHQRLTGKSPCLIMLFKIFYTMFLLRNIFGQ